ncbi:unnamed protein product [Caenorhabditis auriculariae]|uniref:RNA methyltransferase n=1 Tax=Caenorhabditis auriculariae TaxID=2777116 RepID=A0A8S1H8C2_9PELO|nr:unnamed protein product [Caenorhabditis auriculariae]
MSDRRGGTARKHPRRGSFRNPRKRFLPGGTAQDPLNLANVQTENCDDEADKALRPINCSSPTLELPKKRARYSDIDNIKSPNHSPKKAKRNSSGSPVRKLHDKKSKEEDAETKEKAKNAEECKKVKKEYFNNKYCYGNFDRYYGIRLNPGEKDQRLSVMKKEWFEKKSVLDIGCNVGFLTLSIAREFCPRRILGIDIDEHLIGVARKNIRHYCDQEVALLGKYPASFATTFGPVSQRKPRDFGTKFPDNVWFRKENYVFEQDEMIEMVEEEFDVILALSITKWIHLNWGDDGMRRFFKRAFKQLLPGGRLVIEPQPFDSYRKRSKMTEKLKENYSKILFKPEDFEMYLIEEIGFESVEHLGVTCAKSKGFERSIDVYLKPLKPKGSSSATVHDDGGILKFFIFQLMSNVVGGCRRTPRLITRKANILRSTKQAEREAAEQRSREEGEENPDEDEESDEVYREKPLPGVADEVESYPCKFCVERVFLTAQGLEKHGKMEHKSKLDELATHITTIRNEWRKREFERSRVRQRIQMARLRQEDRAHQNVREGRDPTDHFESCTICHVLINMAHPTAMESHIRAHKKNDELRVHLLDRYGAEFVATLTCEACQLVFTEDRKLQMHIATCHSRKKRFICKYCGTILPSVTELNLHKTDVHGISISNPRIRESLLASRKRKIDDYQGDNLYKKENATNYGKSQPCGTVTAGDAPCRIFCPDCGLLLNRPALLVRHMFRVHSKHNFSCIAESGGLPSFKIDVERAHITWTCCGMKFDDRRSFIGHRREEHVMSIEGNQVNSALEMEQLPIESPDGNFEGQLVTGPDGTMQVIIPDGVDLSSEIFVMMDPGETFDPKQSKVQLVQAPRMIGQEEHLMQEEIHAMYPEEEGEVITLTEEQFQQLQMQMGDEWGNMEVVFVNEGGIIDDKGMIPDDGTMEGPMTMFKKELVDGDYEEVIEEGVVHIEEHLDEIDGNPLFD